MRIGPATAALLSTIALAGAARADGRVAAASRRTVEIPLGRVAPGLEASLPRDGSYGPALEAVRAANYRRAGELFGETAAELRRAAAAGTIPAERARSLRFKCEWELVQIEHLRRSQREGGPSTRFERHYEEAQALHNLYLTSRAWLGHDDLVLFTRADTAYREALAASREERIIQEAILEAILTHAGLLATAGKRKSALLELERVPVEVRWADPFLVETAYVYTALGQPERAFDALFRARDTHPQWPARRHLYRAMNDFDPLRDDPRFQKLVGEEE